MCQNSPTAMQEVKTFSGEKTPGPPAAAYNAAGKGAYNAGEGRGKGSEKRGGKDCVMALGGMDAPGRRERNDNIKAREENIIS